MRPKDKIIAIMEAEGCSFELATSRYYKRRAKALQPSRPPRDRTSQRDKARRQRATPQPGEVRLHAWLAAEARARGIHEATAWRHYRAGLLRPHAVRRVNSQIVFVRPPRRRHTLREAIAAARNFRPSGRRPGAAAFSVVIYREDGTRFFALTGTGTSAVSFHDPRAAQRYARDLRAHQLDAYVVAVWQPDPVILCKKGPSAA